MLLEEVLRNYVLNSESISRVARESGVPQPTLQEFAVGKADGSYADLRLTSAQKLLEYFGIDESISDPGSDLKRSRKMLLADELKVSECSDSPEKFKERLIEGVIGFFPGQTIDGLVCNPLQSLEYCNKIRAGVGTESLADVVILKALMNIRKRKDCPTGLKPLRTRRILKNELAACGCLVTPEAFKQLVVDGLADMYKNRTIDELVCHPREARMLCNYIRGRAECESMPDPLILSTLMNVRKAG